MSIVLIKEYNVVVNSDELIGTTIGDAVDGVPHKSML
jgi:hypothetical protein